MFVMDQSDTYTWTVQIEYPDEGRSKKASFEAEFKRLEEPQIQDIRDQINEAYDSKCHADIAKKILVGWKGVTVGKDHEDFPFSESNLEKLLRRPAMPSYIVKAWLESLSGSKIKN